MPEPQRWAFTYRVSGDVRFISHKDMMRVFQRALARAALPVRFSEGFNPHAKISVALPRPVGISSDVEVIAIEFSQPVEGQAVRSALANQMPDGMEIVDAQCMDRGERWTPVRVEYRIEADDRWETDLNEPAQKIINAEEIIVERTFHKNGNTRRFNARPYISDVEVTNHGVTFELFVTREGTLRPVEFARILGLDESRVAHRIHRSRIEWHKEKKRANQSHDTANRGTNKEEESCSKET